MTVESFKGARYLAEQIKDRLDDIMTMYECVLVADYYDLIGRIATFTDSKYGWRSLAGVKIVMTDEICVYELTMPNPLPLD